MRLLKAWFSIKPAFLTLGTILLVVLLFFSGTPLLDLIELKTYDLRFRSRGPVQPSPAVVLALVDEKSLDTEGRWPWPRSRLATLVDMLSQDGARVIGFDIGFLEPDENSQLTFIQHFSEQVTALGITNPALADFINESKTHADNDLALAHAIKNSSATVVLGYFFHMSAADLDARLAQQDIDQQLQRISASKYPFISYKGPGTDVVPFLKAYAPESNLEILTEAAAASGYFSLQSDQDGVVRWMPLMIQGGEELLLNYPGPPKTFPYFSISDILSGKLARGTFTDKIVLFGATATGTYDMRSTPFSTVYPGAEIHATIIDNILTQRFITKPRWSEIYDLLAIIILGALIGITLPRLGAVKGLLCATGLFILHIFIARWLFVHFGVR